jgi:alkaline phosphatase D
MHTWIRGALALLLIPAATLQASDIRIAFGSCAKQDREQTIWTAIEAENPDTFLFIGDNIYGDTEDPAVLRDKYRQLGAQPGFERFRRRVPILATWDDHDYGRNDAGREYPMKVQSQDIFLDFFEVPEDSPRRQREGVYHADLRIVEGLRIQTILLDTRYFRSPLGSGESGTILGPVQWNWLEYQLKQSADLRIIASSIQFLAPDHPYEKWQNFPQESQRMLQLIARTGAEGVIFVSGDRHLGEISVLQNSAVPYPIHDLTSSGMTDPLGEDAVSERNRLRYPGTNAHTTQQFGMIQLVRSKNPLDPWEVSLQLRDGRGQMLERINFPLSRLRMPARS